MTVPSVSMKSALGMAHPAPVNGGDLALGPDHVTLRHLAILLIQQSSSLLWLRRCTSCSASVPVTGGSVSVELLHRQLDFVTGIAAFLLSICASVHPSPVPLESLQDRHKIWNPSGRPLSRSQRYMPHVSASRPNSVSRCAEPPPRPPN